MTTENIEGLEDIDELIGKIGPAIPKRRAAVKKEMDGRKRHEAHIAMGAAALVQRSHDKRAKLEEEAGQLDTIERVATAMLVAANGPTDDVTDVPVATDAPTTPVDVPQDDDATFNPEGLFSRTELNGMSNSRLQLVAGVYGMDLPIYTFDRQKAIERIIDAQHRWCIENGEQDPNGRGSRRFGGRINPRNWGVFQWVCAFIGLILGLLIWAATPEWVGRNMDPSGIRTAVNFLWFVTLTSFGFFLGAIIGAEIEGDNDDS